MKWLRWLAVALEWECAGEATDAQVAELGHGVH
jgi:hypothetical protein